MSIGRRPGALLGLTLVALAMAWASSAFARLVKPCTPGDPAHILAERELASIDRAVRALSPGDNPEALAARIAKLVSTRCFEILDSVETGAKSGLSLKTYWEDGGFDR